MTICRQGIHLPSDHVEDVETGDYVDDDDDYVDDDDDYVDDGVVDKDAKLSFLFHLLPASSVWRTLKEFDGRLSGIEVILLLFFLLLILNLKTRLQL